MVACDALSGGQYHERAHSGQILTLRLYRWWLQFQLVFWRAYARYVLGVSR